MQAPRTPERIAPPSEQPTPGPSPFTKGLGATTKKKELLTDQNDFPAAAAAAKQWFPDDEYSDNSSEDDEALAPEPATCAAREQSAAPEQKNPAPRPLRRGQIDLPKPGSSGVEGCMAGLTCVSTGIFPEVGGGTHLNVGKDRVKAMVQSFGGRVTGSVSGKTDILIVGKKPGEVIVSKARANPKITLMSIQDLKTGIETGDVLAAATPVQIKAFAKKRSAPTDEGGPDAKKKKKSASAPKRSATDAPPRPKRAKQETPVAVYKPSCMELFGEDGDRGEDACGQCKRRRFFKSGAPKGEQYSRDPKAGYVDRASTHYAGCRHPDGPGGA